jgi:small subunit ribosomal protein S6
LSDEKKQLYEAMFLVDSAVAVSDWEALNERIRKILERNRTEIVSMKKWDERRLAYDVQGKSRGTYILSYFRAGGESIAGIERDVQLSEQIMRVLILRAVPGMTGPGQEESAPELVVATKETAPEKAEKGAEKSG